MHSALASRLKVRFTNSTPIERDLEECGNWNTIMDKFLRVEVQPSLCQLTSGVESGNKSAE